MGGKDPQKVGLNYDEVMDYIGQFGRFQRKIFLWLSLVSAAAGLAVVVFAFTAFVPKYRQGTIFTPKICCPSLVTHPDTKTFSQVII